MTRNRIPRSLLALVALLALGAAALARAETRDAMTHFFHQSFGNLKEEAETARAEGKLGLLVMFNDPDCPWCNKMKATVLSQSGVQDYYRRYFRPLHIDTRGDTPLVDFSGREMAEKDFAFREHRVRATPVFIFFDLEGRPVMRYTGATATVEEFVWLGEFVQSGEYRHKNFTVYKRERLAAKRSS
ncbi:thioredoxin [Sulfurifustis variabilis]|uniref:Thioredoxin n=1 Tax=Sulfurifustis variabilis TaxID=1675686 RepID=A0A1B4V679_9GAMM|nr:thioredoxin family protein [Sulfurifustis variabilis]BAU49039.1 thioredoxin [Sulfurifustis variabilis]